MHSSLNIFVGLFVEISSRYGNGHGDWSNGLLGLF